MITSKEQQLIEELVLDGHSLELLAKTKDGRELLIVRSLKIPKSKLAPNDWNFNNPSQRESEAIQESVDLFGQINELVVRPHPDVDGSYQIIDGEQRFGKLSDITTCHIIFGFTDGELRKLTAILNLTKGQPSFPRLGTLLKGIQEEFGKDLVIALPYTQEQADRIILGEIPWEKPNPPGSGTGGEDGWVTFVVKVPIDAMDVIQQGRDLIASEVELNKDRAIAWGQVIEYMAADYLGH